MARFLRTTVVAFLGALALAGTAQARGGDYVFEGGSEEARAQVRAALAVSRFDWSLVPQQVTITISRCGCGGARPGQIILDEDTLVGSGFGARYAWGIVQHEFAHQVDFLLLEAGDRRKLRRVLGGKDWCYEVAGLMHDEHGCERFATALTWAFWPAADNIQNPHWHGGDSLKRAKFRKLVKRLVQS
jgi:hypothetical protein